MYFEVEFLVIDTFCPNLHTLGSGGVGHGSHDNIRQITCRQP